jgi:hypothetical protein
MPLRFSSISSWLKRKYGLYRSKNVPFDMASVMLSPEMRAISSIVSLFSITTKRQGWLLSCEGARPAASRRMRWCSSETGSGRKAPFVVLRRRMASSSSMRSLPVGGEARDHEAREDEGRRRDGDERVPPGVRPSVGDRGQGDGGGEEGQGGAMAARRAGGETGDDGESGRRAGQDVEGVVHPA